jgi:hypothetical protein
LISSRVGSNSTNGAEDAPDPEDINIVASRCGGHIHRRDWSLCDSDIAKPIKCGQDRTSQSVNDASQTWEELARNSLASESYASTSSLGDCVGDCAHEEYGFANALLISVTDESQCHHSSFEREEHRAGCLAYLAALRNEVTELRQWLDSPTAMFICVDEKVIFERTANLHSRSIAL